MLSKIDAVACSRAMPWRGLIGPGLAGLRAGGVIGDEPHPSLALLICG